MGFFMQSIFNRIPYKGVSALAAAFLAIVLSLFVSGCAKMGAVFFDGPRVISGEKTEQIFIPEVEEDFTIVHVDYYDIQTKGEWERIASHINVDGTSFVDGSWFRVDAKGPMVILNAEENTSGKRRCVNIVLESDSGESYITIYQKSL